MRECSLFRRAQGGVELKHRACGAPLLRAAARAAFCHLQHTHFALGRADLLISVLGKDKMADARNSPQWPILVGGGEGKLEKSGLG